jgi:hypothetical protein
VRGHILGIGHSPTQAVLNSSQQYLYHCSSLTKILESLATQGNDQAVAILLPTTDPATLSSPMLIYLGYAIFSSPLSLPWSESLHKHFTKQAIPKAQPTCHWPCVLIIQLASSRVARPIRSPTFSVQWPEFLAPSIRRLSRAHPLAALIRSRNILRERIIGERALPSLTAYHTRPVPKWVS